MAIWEYEAVGYAFVGPAFDDWPRQPEYAARVDEKRREMARRAIYVGNMLSASDGDDVDGLHDEYTTWVNTAENEYLNAMGAAGFELVALHRDARDPKALGRWPVTIVRAYFKREQAPENPPPPAPIGFRAPGDDS